VIGWEQEDGEGEEKLTGKAATQERILISATELFLERGYERTTISQVAERANVSRATVFWHFSDKAGLFREAFNRLLEPFRRSLERDFSDLPAEKRLIEQLELYDSFVSRHRGPLEGFVKWAIENEDFRGWMVPTLLDMHQRYGGVLTETIADLVPTGFDPRRLALGLLVMLDGNLFISFFDPIGRAAEERHASIQEIAALIPRRVPKPG